MRARASVNGGSLLLQAIALGAPCVAAPIAEDQPARISLCAARGYVRPAALDASSLAREARCWSPMTRSGQHSAPHGVARPAQWPGRRGRGDCAPAAGSRAAGCGRCPAGRDERLRIMQVILSRGFAGSERAAAEACNAMCARHDVALVIRQRSSQPGRREHPRSPGSSGRGHRSAGVPGYAASPGQRRSAPGVRT